jgi:hypothetical protein
LHNFFYALAEITRYSDSLTSSLTFLNTIFFGFAIFICPVGYLVGTLGTIVLALPKKKPI